MNALSILLTVGGLLFALGLFATLARREARPMLVGLLLLLQGAFAISVALAPALPKAPVLSLLILVVTPSLFLVALLVLLALRSRRKTVDLDRINLTRG